MTIPESPVGWADVTPAASSAPPVAAGPIGRLDRIPVTRLQLLWILVLGMGYLIETFDNLVFAYLAPAIRTEWGLSIGQVGFVTSAVFLGMLFGAVLGGHLSDRIGRRAVLIWSSIFYSLTSLMSALAPNFEVLAISRILTGVGVQAATGVIMVYISEMFPKASRGRFVTMMMFFGFAASPLTAFVALSIAPTGEGAWRWVFALGSVGVLIAVVVAVALPETVRWLATQGRTSEATSVVEKLEAVAGMRAPLLPVEPEAANVRQASFRELLKREYLRRVIVLAATFSLLIFCVYGFVSWVPTILVERGMAHREALEIASIISLGSLAAPLVLFAVADRIERKTALLIAGPVAGAALVVFGTGSDTISTIVAGMVAQIALAAASTSFYTYIPEIFPTHVRGVGAGTVNGIGRIAGVASGITVAAMYSGLGATTLYIILGLGLVVMGLVIAFFGPRTTGRSLEKISRTDPGHRPGSRGFAERQT